jgi:proteasome lid subunit RPN8/RPN11
MLKIPEIIWNQVIEHLQGQLPKEGCGLLGGTGDTVQTILPGRNIHGTPMKAYFLDPREQFDFIKSLRKQKLELLAIYHSHPDTPPYPSATDMELAYSTEVYNLIVSFTGTNQPLVRNYHYRQGKALEQPLQIGNIFYETDSRDMEF